VSHTTAALAVRSALADVAKAFGHERREEPVERPAQEPRRAESLAERLGLSLANSAQHCQQSRLAAWSSTHVTAPASCIDWTPAPRRISCPCSLLCATWQDMRRRRRNVSSGRNSARHELQPIAARELLVRRHQRDAVIVDVCPEDERRDGCLRGARNIPLPRLRHPLAELLQKREIAAYRRHPNCVLSFEAVARLRARGF